MPVLPEAAGGYNSPASGRTARDMATTPTGEAHMPPLSCEAAVGIWPYVVESVGAFMGGAMSASLSG